MLPVSKSANRDTNVRYILSYASWLTSSLVFLFQLLLIIAFLLTEVLLPPQTSILSIPYKMVLERLLPDIYTPDVPVTLHPYFASGLLLVSVTTLVLFFASGMYSEKIAYANKYVLETYDLVELVLRHVIAINSFADMYPTLIVH